MIERWKIYQFIFQIRFDQIVNYPLQIPPPPPFVKHSKLTRKKKRKLKKFNQNWKREKILKI